MASTESLKWWSSPRSLIRSILMLDDTEHSIAMGTAVGMLIGMTPTVGIQMIIVMCVAFISRPFFQFNRVAALVTVYISNPLTVVPIYYGLFRIGAVFTGGSIERSRFSEILNYDGFEGWWSAITALFVDIGTPLLVGTLIVAPISGLLTYPVMRYLLARLRKQRRLNPVSEDSI